MKKLFKNTKHFKFFTLIALFGLMSEAWGASAVATVSALTGRAFVSLDGRTQSLKVGDQVPSFAEVFTEVGAQVTLSDYFDHKYHLAGSGHIQFLNKSLQLKEGYLWVQSFQDRHTFSVQTANAIALFKRGEGIVSFDSVSGRSQLLVKKGQFDYANSLNPFFTQTVSEGLFSFVITDQDEGAPRAPTPIGYQSFKQIVALFKDVQSESDNNAPARNVASVVEAPNWQEMQPAHAVAPKPTVDPAMEVQLKELYAPKLAPKKVVKKWQPTYEKKSGAKVRIFGSPSKGPTRTVASETPKKPSSRTPASVGSMAPEIKQNDVFESKLMQEYKNQMRHSQETNKLINELKSFDQDYVQGY